MSFLINSSCISCGKCEKQCPESAIYLGDDQFLIEAEECTSCGLCLGHCPIEAIIN